MCLKRRALVVDDEQQFETLFNRMLALLEWECEIVSCRNDAMAHLKARPFDAIIIDYHSPQANGLNFICLLRREGITAPAIVMFDDVQTLKSTPRELLNVSAVLLKPFLVADLKAALTMTSSP